ncbi:hypothetical protein AM501_13935 [Aneurinibacillus migulanus]|uniref:HlyD family efflux transporter periplasmic adaptor subunit n=1 Tax=Aneurinibacillus migulanus TaxID=47500 RepID=UPI0006B597DC|nr:HlyD family efflux transporter periplasmic adaptor subunit [Aneurinibacillus migulanus]KPD07728.1 hypothetical protein AM501_13935 [Aneurinibacillus migulanus]
MSSPEKLDILMTVARPRHWIALLAVLGLVVAFFIWAIFSTIPVQKTGTGVFVLQGETVPVVAAVAGQVTDIGVQPGDRVSRGDVVARLFNPAWIPNGAVAFDASQNLLEQSRLVSLQDGSVTQLHVMPGQWLKVGDPVLTLETVREEGGAEAVIYVPVQDGKDIAVGMEARVWPNQDRGFENGAMLGKVTSVSGVPASLERMERTTGSHEIATKFMEAGPVVEIRVSLQADEQHPTGFHWTAPRAASGFHAQTGMICSVDFIVGKSRPIDWIF